MVIEQLAAHSIAANLANITIHLLGNGHSTVHYNLINILSLATIDIFMNVSDPPNQFPSLQRGQSGLLIPF